MHNIPLEIPCEKGKKMDGDIILVAVDASKEITDSALEWAVRNVARASDSLILLALLPSQMCSLTSPYVRRRRSRMSQFFSCLLKKFGKGQGKRGNSSDDIVLINGVHHDVVHRINNVFAHMMQKLCSAYDLMQLNNEVKIVADVQLSCVALKAKELQATWVILDRHLKIESDYCLKLLNCNIVLMDHAMPKILKAVNLPTVRKFNKGNNQSHQTESDMSGLGPRKAPDCISNVTTQSSLDAESVIFEADVSFSLSSPSTSNLIARKNLLDLNSQYFHEKVEAQVTFKKPHWHSKFQKASNFVTGKSHPKLLANNPLYDKNNSFGDFSEIGLSKDKINMEEVYGNLTQKTPVPPRRSVDSACLRQNLESSASSKQQIAIRDSISDNKSEPLVLTSTFPIINRTSSVRKAMSLYMKQPPNPPPLCSICKYNAPVFGKSPRKFSFKEIERATNGFSSKNFLAEGGFGPVHKGVLPDGQVVAVKQHKTLSAQGASEFCSEVEVLSCAQHRNLVMLVGYCTETEWLLVYEFACNGSLDKHLYGAETKELMSWENRMKVAIGAARGLRYLHEDCRVGCIVHRDFRPNNILLTHDYEAMIGDFGLARWQVDGQSAEETRVIGALGYLAPEYTQSGLITEKADVYAFGVVLLELLSGFNVTEFSRRTGQQFVSEWGSSLLESMKISEIIDPRLGNNYVKKEVEVMMVAANLCISPHPEKRPRMSEILKILEGDVLTDMASDHRQKSSLCLSQDTKRRKSTEQPCPPRISGRRESEQGTIKPKTLSENQPEDDVSEEYQAYLHNSLAKFVQNLNGNSSMTF